MNGRYTIYPETHFLTEEQIRTALSDAVANQEVAVLEPLENLTLTQMCELLEDTGNVTFAAEGSHPSPSTEEILDRMDRS